ncbi:hypothetical protein ACMFMF_009991 [Clarireedia jacksonii]
MVPLLSQLMLMIELSPQIAAGSDLFFNYVLLGDTVSVGIRIQLTTEGTTEEGLWKRLRERLQQLFNHIAWDVNNEAIHVCSRGEQDYIVSPKVYKLRRIKTYLIQEHRTTTLSVFDGIFAWITLGINQSASYSASAAAKPTAGRGVPVSGGGGPGKV